MTAGRVEARAHLDGATVLDDVEAYLRRFVIYPSAHALAAHTLWIAHTHGMRFWASTPRIAFLSPEPGSGKSRCLEVTELLVPRPVHSVNATSAYLFRKVSDEAGPPTVLFDEIDTLFGPRSGDHEDIRGMLNAGHRRGASAGRCVVRGRVIETEELPAYCAVALAGLNDLPDTLMTRSVVVRMRRPAPGERHEAFRRRVEEATAARLADRLARWVESQRPALDDATPSFPPGLSDRPADVWEALLAVADAAGGDWPVRARAAALALVREAQTAPTSLGILLLTDLRGIFHGTDRDHLRTTEVLELLNGLEEAPWSNLRGRALDANRLSRMLGRYGVKRTTFRDGATTAKGYARGDLLDPWSRYLTPADAVTAVTDVTAPLAGPPTVCRACGDPLDTAAVLAAEDTCTPCASRRLT